MERGMAYNIKVDHDHGVILQTATDIFTEHESCSAIREIRRLREFPDYSLVLDFRYTRQIALSCDHLEYVGQRIATEIPVCSRALLVNDRDREMAEVFTRIASRGFEAVRLFDDLESAYFWAARKAVAA